jgi:hypothetical protein
MTGWFMVFNTTLNNISVISCGSVLLVEETGEKHRPAVSHWLALSHNAVSNRPRLSGVQTHDVFRNGYADAIYKYNPVVVKDI